MLDVFVKKNPSRAGIPRVSIQETYKTGKIVSVQSLNKKVILHPHNNFFYVLETPVM